MFFVRYDIWLSHHTVFSSNRDNNLYARRKLLKNTDVIITSELRVWSKPINGKSFRIVQEHEIWLYEYYNMGHTEEKTDIERLRNFCV